MKKLQNAYFLFNRVKHSVTECGVTPETREGLETVSTIMAEVVRLCVIGPADPQVRADFDKFIERLRKDAC